MKAKDERERLIEELKLKHAEYSFRGYLTDEEIADFILEDRKRIEKEYEEIKEKAWKYDQLCK